MKSGIALHWMYPEDYTEPNQLWRTDQKESQSKTDTVINSGLIEIFKKLTPKEKSTSSTYYSIIIGSILHDSETPAIENLDIGNIVAFVVEVKHQSKVFSCLPPPLCDCMECRFSYISYKIIPLLKYKSKE